MPDDRNCKPDDPCLPCRADSDTYASPAGDDRVALERIARDVLIDGEFHSPATTMLGLVDAVLENGWSPPARVIESAEDLEALPDRTVIRTGYDTAAQKSDDVWEFPNEVGQFTSEAVDLPATVLWQPEVSNA
jgi:hypothetical protein